MNGEWPLVTVPPDAATSVVFCSVDRRRDVVVVGPRTRASYHHQSPVPLRITIRLEPGRAGLLAPAADLVDRVVPLRQLWGDPAEFADRLRRWLRTRGAQGDLVHAATRLLSGSGVRATAERLHISERRLRTLFAETVGLSPKHVARIDRVRSVLAGAGQEGLARLAIRTGYYDQSHLTTEFRALMGVPPAAYLAGRRPPATPCGAELGQLIPRLRRPC